MVNQMNAVKKYDAENGSFAKDVKVTDIFTISTTDNIGSVGSTLASGTINAYQEVYIVGISGYAAAAGNLHILNGTSTLMSFKLGATTDFSRIATRDAPLLKISGASIISIGATTGGTFTASLWAVREPKFAYLET